MEEFGGQQSTGSQRVRHEWSTNTHFLRGERGEEEQLG